MINKVNSRDEFYSLMNEDKLSIITLGSKSCPHCHELEGTLNQVDDLTDVPIYKVLTDEVGGLARELQAQFMPYTAFCKGGKILYWFYGQKTKDELLNKISELL